MTATSKPLPTASNQVLDEAVAKLNCKEGSVRSLALSAASVLEELQVPGDPNRMAWDMAKALGQKKKEFTMDDARSFLKNFVNEQVAAPATKPENTKPAGKAADKATTKGADKPATTRAPRAAKANADSPAKTVEELAGNDLKEAQDEKVAKNERIRVALKKGYEVAPIARAMGIGYQRVKNVLKAINKSAGKATETETPKEAEKAAA